MGRVTRREKDFVLSVLHLNKNTHRIEVTKVFRLGRIKAVYNWRSRKNLLGRFGGCWNWKLGFTAGGRTLIVHLLVFSIRFTLEEAK